MHKLRRVDIERGQEIFERLNIYVNRLVEQLNPELIILHGSFAAGDFNEGSDVDLVVVAEFEEPFLERIGLLLRLNAEHLPLEPVGYTYQEFEEMLSKNNPFIANVLATGKILHSTDLMTELLQQHSPRK